MTSGVEPIIIEGLRAVFVVGLPITLVVVLASTIVAALQSAMTVSEPALGYAIRVLALAALGYAFLPAVLETIATLARTAWG